MASKDDIIAHLGTQAADVNRGVKVMEQWVNQLLAAQQPVTTTTPLARTTLGRIGDSLTEQSNAAGLVVPAGKAAPANFTNVDVRAKFGHFIVAAANAGDPSTLDYIDQIRADGAEPDVWVIALGTNLSTTSTTAMAAGDTSIEAGLVDQVLAKIDSVAGNHLVVWVNIGTQWSYPSSYGFHEAVNAMFAKKMAARGKWGYLADWWTWMKNNQPAGWVYNQTGTAWFPANDGTHMTTAGYQAKETWLAGEIDKACTAAGTTTTTTTSSSGGTATVQTVNTTDLAPVPDWATPITNA